MQDKPLFDVPIMFAIFNRPDTTRVVFDEIRKAKPRKLFIVADGPREGRPGEKERCEATRKITEQIDWECEVHRNYSDINLGCAKRLPSGISWFFEHVSEGIILEDDGLPHPDFFPYCQEMLERYRDVKEVVLIGANNFQGGKVWGDGSYYFSAHPHLWGEALWKRTWDLYDVRLTGVTEEDVRAALQYYFPYHQHQRDYWLEYFQRVKADPALPTWDPQLLFILWKRRGLSVIPNINLVSNIGFGEDATHTHDMDSNCSNVLTAAIMPLVHPKEIALCREADLRFYELCFAPLPKKIIRKISRIMHDDDPWGMTKKAIASLL